MNGVVSSKMNLIQHARGALAAAVLVRGVLGPSAAPTFADSAGLQPTQIVFASTSSTLDRAKAFTTPAQMSLSGASFRRTPRES
jgi:hypothetical protein